MFDLTSGSFVVRITLVIKKDYSKKERGGQMTTTTIEVKATEVVSTTTTDKPAVAVELSAQAIKALATFAKAKEAEAKAKARKAKAEATLRKALGKALKGTIDGVAVVSVVSSKTTFFDREEMKKSFPEAYDATLRTTEYDYLKTL